MSIKIMSAVFESETLGPTERLIMLSLADHADDAGRCYPSISRLCKRTGLGERAIQNNLKALVAKGYVTIVPNAGPNGTNVFYVRTVAEPKPEIAAGGSASPPHLMRPAGNAPRTRCAQTPASGSKTPAPGAPKPSRTIIEPSDRDTPAKPADVLSEIASAEATRSFIAFRTKIRKPLTETAARRIGKALAEIVARGGDADDALGMAEERGWQAIKPEWYFKEAHNDRQSPQHNRPLSRADATSLGFDVVARTRRASSEGIF